MDRARLAAHGSSLLVAALLIASQGMTAGQAGALVPHPFEIPQPLGKR